MILETSLDMKECSTVVALLALEQGFILGVKVFRTKWT